jgi:predicted RNase H-like nuclease (RuvC/YqgF family)
MKFGTQILTLITRIFNLAADSSESEIHQSLSTMKTIDEQRAEIRTEFESQLTELAELKAGDVTMRTQIDALNTRITDLEAQVTERDTTIATLNATIVTLGKQPAVPHTGGGTETPAAAEADKKFNANQSPFTSRARELLGFA